MKKVALGTEGAYPPFNWIDENGDFLGIDVEIGNALCATANLERTWAAQDRNGITPGLLAKKYDAIVASMPITEGSGIEITDDGVQGKAGGVQRATIHENFLRDNYGDVVTIKA